MDRKYQIQIDTRDYNSLDYTIQAPPYDWTISIVKTKTERKTL